MSLFGDNLFPLMSGFPDTLILRHKLIRSEINHRYLHDNYGISWGEVGFDGTISVIPFQILKRGQQHFTTSFFNCFSADCTVIVGCQPRITRQVHQLEKTASTAVGRFLLAGFSSPPYRSIAASGCTSSPVRGNCVRRTPARFDSPAPTS